MRNSVRVKLVCPPPEQSLQAARAFSAPVGFPPNDVTMVDGVCVLQNRSNKQTEQQRQCFEDAIQFQEFTLQVSREGCHRSQPASSATGGRAPLLAAGLSKGAAGFGASSSSLCVGHAAPLCISATPGCGPAASFVTCTVRPDAHVCACLPARCAAVPQFAWLASLGAALDSRLGRSTQKQAHHNQGIG